MAKPDQTLVNALASIRDDETFDATLEAARQQREDTDRTHDGSRGAAEADRRYPARDGD